MKQNILYPATGKTHYLLLLATVITLSFFPQRTMAWGSEGHAIVAKIAMQYLTPDARKNVLEVLGNMPVDTAANWMDIMRPNRDYDFMKPWHYIDFGRDKQYEPSTDENIVNRIIITYNELRHKQVLCSGQIRMDLLVLFHLMGDLSQPLHTGYDDDLGGNRRPVQYDTLKTNLHHFWDEDIIRLNKITLENCLAMYQAALPGNVDTIKGIHPVLWMKESRSLLPMVYDFSEFFITDSYLKKADKIVKRQLLVAGLRLAEMLNKLFVSIAPEVSIKDLAAKYKNGIDAKDALNYNGKKVTACGRVFGIKSTDKVTFINVGDVYPKSPLTIVIFAKDRKNFPPGVDEFYANKNVCVKGEVVLYKDKAEIIVTRPEEIIIE